MVAETVKIKKTNNFDKTDSSAKKVMDMRTAKRRAEKRKLTKAVKWKYCQNECY